MDSYLVYPSLLLFLFVIFLLLKRMTSPRKQCDSHPKLADEKANVSQQQPVPGDSLAYYTGDSSHDVLEIEALDLAPNPPTDRFTLDLRGEIKERIGLNPQLYISVYLNGHLGPTVEKKLCADSKIKITQRGVPLPDGQTPTDGNMTVSYKNLIPYTWLKKGGKGNGCGGW